MIELDSCGKALAYWKKNELNKYDRILILPNADVMLNHRIRTIFGSMLGARRGIVIEGRQAADLLALYSLYAFTDKLVIGSLDLPYGRKLCNLLHSGVTTEEELIRDVLFEALN